MDTVIHKYLDGTVFTVHDYMEGQLDADGIPFKKKEDKGKGANLL